MQIIQGPLATHDSSLPEVPICTDRHTLGQMKWRGVADDGTEIIFELAAPLRHGDVVLQSSSARYVIQQQTEPLLEISLNMGPSAAAGIGWAMGNMHLELSAETTRLLAPDEPSARELLGRLRVPFKPTTAVFRPGRFTRGSLASQELGPGHKHASATPAQT